MMCGWVILFFVCVTPKEKKEKDSTFCFKEKENTHTQTQTDTDGRTDGSQVAREK